MSKPASGGKKAVSQNDLRRIMNEQKKKFTANVKKIESPLAKYTESGELRCILCNAPVRSEALWAAHLASKEHLANIAAAKRAKAAKQEVPATFKRPAPAAIVAPPQPVKKPKGILKNSTSSTVPSDFFDSSSIKSEPGLQVKNEAIKKEAGVLNHNGSDDKEEVSKPNVTSSNRLRFQKDETEEQDEKSDKNVESTEVIPEGFFDDPKLDAKVRNVDYKDPVEEEWERFQKAIKEEAEQSQQIIQEEQEEATAERQLEEIDEQMRNWSKVLELERRKDLVNQVKIEPGSDPGPSAFVDDESGDEETFDEFLDWRAKQS